MDKIQKAAVVEQTITACLSRQEKDVNRVEILLWGLLVLLVIAGIIIFFVKRASDKKKRQEDDTEEKVIDLEERLKRKDQRKK